MKKNRRQFRLSPNARKALDAIIRGGTLCANCCYNLSQHQGEFLGERDCSSMRESHLAWDDARKLLPAWLSKEIRA